MTSLVRHRTTAPPAANAMDPDLVDSVDSPESDLASAPAPRTNEKAGQSFTSRPRVTLMDLPTEIHVLVSKELIYPDALSLKHTSRYFYSWVDTGVRLKVAWLVERRELHLDCPNDRRCNLRTDLEFCRGSVTSVTTPSSPLTPHAVVLRASPKVPRTSISLTRLADCSCSVDESILNVNPAPAWAAWSWARLSVPIDGAGGGAG